MYLDETVHRNSRRLQNDVTWWYTYPSDPSENYEFVSWDDEIPNIWKNKIYVPKHQPGTVLGVLPMRMTSFTFSYYLDPKSSNASQPKIGREQPLHPLPNENGKAPIQQRVIRLYPLLM